MRLILALMAFLIIPSTLLLAQDATDKINGNAIPAPIVKPSRDFVMVQFAYNDWIKKPDSINTKFGFAFNAYVCYDFPIKKTNLSFAAGLGVNVSEIYLSGQTVYNTDTSGSHPLKIVSPVPDTFKKVKFVTTYLTAPFELRYFAHRDNRNKGFKAAVGLTVGTLLGSDTKELTGIGGTNVKLKVDTKRYVTPWNFAATARVGWGNVCLFATYNLTNVFKSNVGPPITPATFGICLTGL